jgi:hypothetical protein
MPFKRLQICEKSMEVGSAVAENGSFCSVAKIAISPLSTDGQLLPRYRSRPCQMNAGFGAFFQRKKLQ